jgi:hypothetical protein
MSVVYSVKRPHHRRSFVERFFSKRSVKKFLCAGQQSGKNMRIRAAGRHVEGTGEVDWKNAEQK